ncbi:thiamine phosphate synthase [Pseudorhodoplanes sinuspersici]|uniref:Thiamine phosphate synthase n=1 Tax=Pseudorhodoplanes sinuspersici TaxID=1235591 RepID=A0A1W6ZLY1_9HYPH|nr:thiamine phosphate synthase [Pseudorhodoplanes sinuspersici]ARP98371.1 thiamine phosphate synthase [Pseudorhodoplanes sinuspersici]RKE66036.1 thiamine-phosphate pyrophosphorylase [Pseudorhodoplanes sinuspersici]
MTPGQPDPQRPQPRLYLVTPVAADIASLKLDLLAALDSADIAAVLLRLPDEDDRSLINRVKALAPTVQRAGAALILEGHPAIVARGGADGAHLRSITEFEEVVNALKPDRIAGAGGLSTRHDAMIAAEGGADYVMFGEPNGADERPVLQAIAERVSWWAEVFEAPCVAYAGSFDDIAPLAEAGADFVALGDFIFADPRGIAIAVADAASRLTSKAAVT